jgi:hypothetical protein
MKKKFIARFLVIGCLCILSFGLTTCDLLDALEGVTELNFTALTLFPQETRMWCWAASGEMVMDKWGTSVDQCDHANYYLGEGGCCDIALCPTPVQNGDCVHGGWPQFGHYGFDFDTTSNAALSWNEVKNQVDNNRPWCITWKWLGNGGHMMVGRGYMTKDEEHYVCIADPWSPCNGDTYYVTYDFYDEDPADHTHWNDYYNVVPK